MNELQPFVLEFDSEGKLVQPQQQTDILQAVGAENPTVTDLWVLSYGWNNDIQSTASQQTYQQWTTHLLAEMRQIQNEQYQPLFVELFWPSEAWADAVAQPASLLTPHQSAPTATDREEFSEHYTRLLDPAGRQGADAANDFGYLYDVLTQLRPTEEQTHTFVQRLNKYSLNDPHNDQDEQDTIMVAPVETIVQRLLAGPLLSLEPSLLAARSEVPHAPAADTTLLENLLNFFRVFTFWTMKARSAVVGTQGVYPFLKQVKQTREPHERPLRIHLLGHSFGAKLLTSAVYSARQEAHATPFVETLVLLLGAFSKFAFSTTTPAVRRELPAGYAAVVTERLVANPLVAIYSQNDLANLLFYPLGMLPVFAALRLSGQVPAGESEEPADRLGSMGAHGIDGLGQQAFSLPRLLPVDLGYDWSTLGAISCLNVDGSDVINQGTFPVGAHNDINHAAIFHLALAMSLRQPPTVSP